MSSYKHYPPMYPKDIPDEWQIHMAIQNHVSNYVLAMEFESFEKDLRIISNIVGEFYKLDIITSPWA